MLKMFRLSAKKEVTFLCLASGPERWCYPGLNWSRTTTWLQTWRRWASLTCSRRVEISLEWPQKKFPWTGWVKTKSVMVLLRNIQTVTKGKHQKRCFMDILSTVINNPYKLSQSLSPAEAPGNHHCEWGGDRGCCSDPGWLHAPLLTDPLHCGPSLPLSDLRAPHRLPCVHGQSGQSCTELNLSREPSNS